MKYLKNTSLLIFTLIVYIFIPLIILLNEKLFELKFYILTFIGLLIFLLMKILNINYKLLGINSNCISSIKRNLPLIIIFALLIVVIKSLGYSRYNPSETIWFYLFYIFISCPIQEFLYRGVFGYFEKALIKNKYLILFLSSFCYSFVHIIYRDLITCILTFIIGICWYLLYRKDYNLCGVCLSHIVLGILTIFLGIIN